MRYHLAYYSGDHAPLWHILPIMLRLEITLTVCASFENLLEYGDSVAGVIYDFPQRGIFKPLVERFPKTIVLTTRAWEDRLGARHMSDHDIPEHASYLVMPFDSHDFAFRVINEFWKEDKALLWKRWKNGQLNTVDPD